MFLLDWLDFFTSTLYESNVYLSLIFISTSLPLLKLESGYSTEFYIWVCNNNKNDIPPPPNRSLATPNQSINRFKSLISRWSHTDVINVKWLKNCEGFTYRGNPQTIHYFCYANDFVKSVMIVFFLTSILVYYFTFNYYNLQMHYFFTRCGPVCGLCTIEFIYTNYSYVILPMMTWSNRTHINHWVHTNLNKILYTANANLQILQDNVLNICVDVRLPAPVLICAASAKFQLTGNNHANSLSIYIV